MKHEIKKTSYCSKHLSEVSQRSNVCCHIGENLNCSEKPLAITPLFIERVLLDKFYEKYWMCESCAKVFSIFNKGELWFDPNLRAFLEDESSFDEKAADFSINIEGDLKALIVHVCRACFLEKYGEQVHPVESSIDSLKQRSVTKHKN